MTKLKSLRVFMFVVLCIHFTACKEAFDPSLENPAVNFLVVEGFINTKGVTIIQLTRTQKLAEAGIVKNEVNATVQIENDNSLVVGLTESGQGIYRSAVLNLPPDRLYRLRIKTTSGKEYLSDYTPVKTTPKLNLTWEQTADGLRIYANSADPNNQTHYYKYDYEETWELRSSHISPWVASLNSILGNYVVGKRSEQDQINALICWTSGLSSSVLTTSTKSLSKDVVDKFPIIFIPKGTEKLGVRYSILVKQYALDSDSFNFFEQMKKNSELLGSVFDPLPSTIIGNIKSLTDSNEPVVGNIVAASAEEQRIFIDKNDVQNWDFALPCGIEYAANGRANLDLFFRNDKYLIIDRDVDDTRIPEVIRGYYVANAACLDCRKRNGNNIKPSYW